MCRDEELNGRQQIMTLFWQVEAFGGDVVE